VDAAAIWASYMEENLFERVKTEFDSNYYSARYGLQAEDAWNDYLSVGVTVGRFINRDHELRFMDINLDPAETDTQIAFTLHESPNNIHSITSSDTSQLSGTRLLTIDLWDTLIRRKRPADAPKLATARRILHLGWSEGLLTDQSPWDIFQRRVDIEARISRSRSSEEYELSEVLRILLNELGFTGDVTQNVESLLAFEVDEEILWSEKIQDVIDLIKKVDAQKVIASDFYLNSEHLRTIVSSLVPELSGVDVHSSCEAQSSKRLRGELFESLRDVYGMKSNQHVHIGDNMHSDVRNQINTGGTAIHVESKGKKHANPGEFTKKNISQTFDNLDTIVSSEPYSSEAYKAGQKAAQFAVALVAGAIEEALKQGVGVVHYISREGYFLKQIHDQVAPLISQHKNISARHLTVSRRATFGPSLDCSSTNSLLSDLGRLWSMYSNQSVEALLVSIGLDAEKYRESVESYELRIDERMPELGSERRFLDWLSDDEVVASIQRELQLNKTALLAYFEKSMEIENGNVVVADIGWRGSIQDNIGRILPEVKFHGVYLGLFPYLNEQVSGHTKKAVVFDGNLGEKYFYAEPPAAIERPWTPHVPSVIKFNLTESGEVLAVTEIEAGEVSHEVAEFQSGSIAASTLVARWIAAHGYSANDLRPELQSRLEDYYSNPSTAVAGIWFDSSHDDSFGALNQTSFLKLRPDRTWIENPNLEIISEAQKNSLWQHGYASWAPVKALMTLIPSEHGGNRNDS
jgi:FMN phosphatase YigB (HAD superfamily)